MLGPFLSFLPPFRFPLFVLSEERRRPTPRVDTISASGLMEGSVMSDEGPAANTAVFVDGSLSSAELTRPGLANQSSSPKVIVPVPPSAARPAPILRSSQHTGIPRSAVSRAARPAADGEDDDEGTEPSCDPPGAGTTTAAISQGNGMRSAAGGTGGNQYSLTEALLEEEEEDPAAAAAAAAAGGRSPSVEQHHHQSTSTSTSTTDGHWDDEEARTEEMRKSLEDRLVRPKPRVLDLGYKPLVEYRRRYKEEHMLELEAELDCALGEEGGEERLEGYYDSGSVIVKSEELEVMIPFLAFGSLEVAPIGTLPTQQPAVGSDWLANLGSTPSMGSSPPSDASRPFFFTGRGRGGGGALRGMQQHHNTAGTDSAFSGEGNFDGSPFSGTGSPGGRPGHQPLEECGSPTLRHSRRQSSNTAKLQASLFPPQLSFDGATVDPKVRQVVGRQANYWATSRRHLLMRGRPHAELGIQTSLSTRDYMAATIAVTSLTVQEEAVRRRATEVQERAERASLLQRYCHHLEGYLMCHEHPLLLVALEEHEERIELLGWEEQAWDRLYASACTGMLVSWARRDRDEAQAEFSLLLEEYEHYRTV